MHTCTFKLLTYGTVLKVLILYKNNPEGRHLKTRQFIPIQVINNCWTLHNTRCGQSQLTNYAAQRLLLV